MTARRRHACFSGSPTGAQINTRAPVFHLVPHRHSPLPALDDAAPASVTVEQLRINNDDRATLDLRGEDVITFYR